MIGNAARPGTTLLIGNVGHGHTTGLTVAFEMLVIGMRERGVPVLVADKNARGGPSPNPGHIAVRRVLATAYLFLDVAWKLRRSVRVYLVIAPSRTGFLRDAVVIWLCVLSRRPVVLHLHGGGYADLYHELREPIRAFMRVTLKRAQKLVVLAESLRSEFAFLGDAPVVVVSNGLPPSLAPGKPVGRELRTIGPVTVLYLSNMIPSKGFMSVLEAAAKLHRHYPGRFRWVFCGAFLNIASQDDSADPGDPEAFRQAVAARGLTSVVRYAGSVGAKQKADELQAADLFALPTTYPWEGQPISIIEAMAFGIPVIATAHRGIPELVENGKTGSLINSPDTDALAGEIASIASDPRRYAEMSSASVATYLARFTPERHLDSLARVILQA